MSRIGRILISVSLVCNIILIILCLNKGNFTTSTNYPDESKELTERIDSLNKELLILKGTKDSIERQIDTIYIKIKTNNKEYEEVYNTIINNNIGEDFIFFTEYLRGNKARLDSINNKFPIKRD